jgi:hypothetical protein
MKETNILQLCRLAAAECGATVFRNNVGKLKDINGRWVEFGLVVGSSDLIGWLPDGRFLAIETKVPGKKPSPQQYKFIDAVNKAGGVAFWADNPDTVKKTLTDTIKKV